MWTAVGIKTKLVAMERLAWIDAMRAMNFDTCFWRGAFSYTAVDADTATTRITTGLRRQLGPVERAGRGQADEGRRGRGG